MPKKPKPIDLEVLKTVITVVEKESPDGGLTHAWKEVERLYREKTNSNVSMITLKKEGLTLNIKAKPKGNKRLADHRPTERKPRKRKDMSEHSERMRKEIIDHGKPQYLPLVDKMENGSMKARIKLGCIRCFGYDAKEVKHCTSMACVWHPVRPYQDKETSSDDE